MCNVLRQICSKYVVLSKGQVIISLTGMGTAPEQEDGRRELKPVTILSTDISLQVFEEGDYGQHGRRQPGRSS